MGQCSHFIHFENIWKWKGSSCFKGSICLSWSREASLTVIQITIVWSICLLIITESEALGMHTNKETVYKYFSYKSIAVILGSAGLLVLRVFFAQPNAVYYMTYIDSNLDSVMQSKDQSES